jgi:hypothetical protein
MSDIEKTRAQLRQMIETDPVLPESKSTFIGPMHLHKQWRDLVRGYEATDKRFLDLLTSPEAQDQDILLLCRARAKLRVQMEKTQGLVYQFLMVKGSDHLADMVKADMGGLRRKFTPEELQVKRYKLPTMGM